MKNVALGRRVLDFIEAHPEQFDMATFGRSTDCGTVGCIAGHVLLQSGYALAGYDLFVRPDDSGSYVLSECLEAVRLLGLSAEELDGEAEELFDCQQSPMDALVRFRRLVERSEGVPVLPGVPHV